MMKGANGIFDNISDINITSRPKFKKQRLKQKRLTLLDVMIGVYQKYILRDNA